MTFTLSFFVICTIITFVTFVSCQSPSDYPTSRVPGTCGNITQFDCGNGTCIPFTSVRNCFRDCPNGADEECGTNQVLCDVTVGSGCGKCVATTDASLLCLDQRYVRICERGVSSTTNSPIFRCTGTSNCVPMDWVNDGTNDCGDFSDEDPCMSGYNCSQVDISAPSSISFCTCKNPFKGNGTIWTANDPMYRLRVPGNCSNDPLQFDCGSSCIDINLVRNCVRDCPNGADEGCWAGSTLCSDGCTCSPTSMTSTCSSVTGTLSGTTSVLVSLASSTITSASTSLASTTKPTTTFSVTTTVATTSILTTQSALTSTRSATSSVTTASSTSSPAGTAATAPTTTTTQSATTITSTTQTSTARNTGTTFVGVQTNATSASVNTATTNSNGSTTRTSNVTVVSTTVLPVTVTVPRAGLCSLSQFSCSNGQCVSDLLVLDGKSDCSDGSDERCPVSCAGNQTCFYQPLYHNFTCGCPAGTISSVDRFCLPTTANQPRDCADLAMLALTNGYNFTSGVYIVYKTNCTTNDKSCLIPCTCDMDTDGGGYTVIQHRQNASIDFNRTWDEYKNGFNLGQTDFWQGNEFMSSLTNRIGSSGLYEAIVQITYSNNATSLYKYSRIVIGKESDSYQLTLGTLVTGDVDNLMISRNRNFATFNRDIQTLTISDCAAYWQSGWWFDTMCRDIGNLNVPLASNSRYPYLKGIDWPNAQSQFRNVSSSSMLIRPTWYITSSQQLLTSPATILPRTGQSGSEKMFAINKCLLLMNLVQMIILFYFTNF